MKRVRFIRSSLFILPLLVMQGPAVVLSEDDLSGEYRNGSIAGGRLSIMSDGRELLVSYTAAFGQAAHLCDCITGPLHPWSAPTADGKTRYVGKYGPDDPKLYLDTDASRIRLSGNFLDCCGADWPGDLFERTAGHPPQICSVNSQRATFHSFVDSSGKTTPTGRYVIAGDRVETVTPFATALADRYLIGRFREKQKMTLGLLRRADLTCPTKPYSVAHAEHGLANVEATQKVEMSGLDSTTTLSNLTDNFQEDPKEYAGTYAFNAKGKDGSFTKNTLILRFSNSSLEALYSSNNSEALYEGDPERKPEMLKEARIDGNALTTSGNSQVIPYFRGRFVILKTKDTLGQPMAKKGFLSDFTAWNGPEGKMYYMFYEKAD